MGLRETLNENPRITTGVTIGIIVVILAIILWPGGGSGAGGGGGGVVTQAFFTTDDGQSYFPDDARKVPPFKKDGKDAVRAVVYKCGGKTFVNHMERFSPEAQKKLEALYAKGDAAAANDPSMVGAISDSGLEVKAPGGKDWVKVTDPKAPSIMQPKCPDGGSDVEIVLP